jgi:hypothetical protein
VAPILRQTSPVHVLICNLFTVPFSIISLLGVALPTDYFPSCSPTEMYAFLLDFHPTALSNFGITVLFFLRKNINTSDSECNPTCLRCNPASLRIDRSKFPVARNSDSEANARTLDILSVRTSFVARKLSFLAKLPKTSNLFQAPC